MEPLRPPPIPPTLPPRHRRRWLWRSLATALLLFLIASAIVMADGLRDRLGHADFALVLGNRIEPDGTPSAGLRARLDRTLELFRAGYFATIMVSGGIGKEGFDEAAVMKDYLVAHGVPSAAIITDAEGVNTWASARNAQRLAQDRGFRSVMVISQYFHVPRSRLAMERIGFATVYSAHAHHFELRDGYSLVREVLGYAEYWVWKK